MRVLCIKDGQWQHEVSGIMGDKHFPIYGNTYTIEETVEMEGGLFYGLFEIPEREDGVRDVFRHTFFIPIQEQETEEITIKKLEKV